MKTIAICSNVPELDEGGMFDLGICQKYPGSGWCAKLPEIAEVIGYQVSTGSQAIYAIEKCQANPSTFYVIQEELNPAAQKLLSLGAKPAILMCFESPIYTPEFYAQLIEIKDQFPRQILFQGGTDWMAFPNFELGDIQAPIPWADRKLMSAVISNKFGAMRKHPAELHSARISAIDYFIDKKKLDLFGKGWGNLVPECDDKIKTIKNYKFSLCFENFMMSGYLTEKIIDCFVAGTLPIYLGDPDIEDRTPHDSYINMRAFSDFQELEAYLEDMPEEVAMKMIQTGQDWLRSEAGQKHSFTGFAKQVLRMIEEIE